MLSSIYIITVNYRHNNERQMFDAHSRIYNDLDFDFLKGESKNRKNNKRTH